MNPIATNELECELLALCSAERRCAPIGLEQRRMQESRLINSQQRMTSETHTQIMT